MLIQTIVILNLLILAFLIFCSISYVFLLIMAIHDVWRRFQEVHVGNLFELMRSDIYPPVTVLVAAFNEEDSIINTVESILNNQYEKTRIIVINDGSTDQTLQTLISTYQLSKRDYFIPSLIQTAKINGCYFSEKHPHLLVIDKEHRCKSDSLNIGLNACRTPLVMTVDADSIIEPDTINEMIFYMMTRAHAVAVGASIYVLNGCKIKGGKIINEALPRTYVAGVQACEYLRSFLFFRAGWNSLQGALGFSGTGTLFEYHALLEAGGFDLDNHANDFEIVLHLHAHKKHADIPYQIGFTPVASVWTEVPATLKGFWHQRTQWQKGMLRSLSKHKYMFYNPKYGLIGFFHYPFYLLAETLGAVVEFTAYVLVLLSWILGIFSLYAVILFFLVCLGFITLITVSTVLMNLISYNKYGGLKDIPRLLFYVLSEPIGFRQFSVLCRTVATIKYFFNKKS